MSCSIYIAFWDGSNRLSFPCYADLLLSSFALVVSPFCLLSGMCPRPIFRAPTPQLSGSTHCWKTLQFHAGDLYKRLDVNLQGMVPVVTPGDSAITAMQLGDLQCWAQV